MRIAVILPSLLLVACVQRTEPRTDILPWTNRQMGYVELSMQDCPRQQYIEWLLDEQLRMRGILNTEPEDLTDYDREFRHLARKAVWSLRVGCNNPDRYKK